MSRLLETYQIPYAVVSDGKRAVVLQTVSGEKIGQGIDAIPARQDLMENWDKLDWPQFPGKKLEREKLIFRTYDMENVNVRRKL